MAGVPTGGRPRVDVLLVTGGRWHDAGYARLRLLTELDRHDAAVVTIRDDHRDVAALDRSAALVTYTCDVQPATHERAALRHWVAAGGRWLALHATCSALDVREDANGRTFEAAPPDDLSDLLGGRFLAHPPIEPFEVEASDPRHPLVAGLTPFVTVDELYVQRMSPPVDVLLHTTFAGACRGFLDAGMPVRADAGRQPVMWQKHTGAGTVTYLTLGHCRGRWDLTDLGVADTGRRDRVAWQSAGFAAVLARSVAWAVHGEAWTDAAREGQRA